jgi:hypothetical protein
MVLVPYRLNLWFITGYWYWFVESQFCLALGVSRAVEPFFLCDRRRSPYPPPPPPLAAPSPTAARGTAAARGSPSPTSSEEQRAGRTTVLFFFLPQVSIPHPSAIFNLLGRRSIQRRVVCRSIGVSRRYHESAVARTSLTRFGPDPAAGTTPWFVRRRMACVPTGLNSCCSSSVLAAQLEDTHC